ncbi:MAG: 3-keto-5-aminohexanoate cleavage protein [Sphingobium sp. SCN 64-10]|nr:MAG: 3-keto-5-aminohexanoate cleavage protein [Sphingobium sp. SCN 64-10]
MSNRRMVTIAPTGGMSMKTANPALPTQPQEIADDVYACYKAGASIVAVHARRPDDQATCNPDIYSDINARIRAKCDIIINNSTGGGNSGDMLIERPDGLWESNFEERLRGCDGIGAEMCTFDGVTVVDTVSEKEVVVITTPSRCETLVKRMVDRGIKPEWEVFSPEHILQDVTRLIEKGYDKPPYYINMVLGGDKGFQGAMPYSPEVLDFMVKCLPPQSIWCVSGIGPAQLPASMQALLLGGHVRVGLEDNHYYARGQKATNLMLTERLVRIMNEMGIEPTSAAESRDILGLKPL